MAEEELYQERLKKVDDMRARGDDPWPVRFDRTHLAADLHEAHAGLANGDGSGQQVRVAGRLMSSRTQGKIAFGDLVDGSGKIQLFVSGDQVATFEALDSGDLVGAMGEVIRTKRGELSVRTDEVVLLAKALRPPPDKWHGLKDVDIRYRQRYLDLVANPEARRIAELRIETLKATRTFFEDRNYLEVETPVMHPIPGGGYARPFITHHNSLDTDLYLRVAPELYLKSLIVGGLERLFEIARVFRNEGIGYRWNPEFTMLEAYQAYADYTDMMDLLQDFFAHIATETLGTTTITFEGNQLDFANWKRRTFLEVTSEAAGEEISFDRSNDDLRALCKKHDIEAEDWWGPGFLIAELYEKLAESAIVEPTFVCDHPLAISPLARTHRDNPNLVERFEPVVCGRELGNAFSELNDPIEQRRRFEMQAELRAKGDLEASPPDEPYVRALEHGMPPTGGIGVGIDRLVMMLAGVHGIREVILFPALKPLPADAPEGTQEGD
jgi:lysyl-tRNA synthetase, class II